MSSNTIPSVSCKDLLLKKLSYAVLSSVVSQLLILLVYVFLCNLDLFNPRNWAVSTINSFVSFSTWIFLSPFLATIFAQSVICGRDYIYRSNYHATRFQRFLAVFSFHNWITLFFNIVIGATLTWLLLQLKGSSQKDLFKLDNKVYKLNEDSFYLILGGIFNAIYYFYRIHLSELHLVFPVIYQRKALQIKSQLLPLLEECCVLAVLPTFCYIILYYFCGEIIITKFIQFFEIEIYKSDMGVVIYLYVWLFGALYFYKMSLMRTFFNVFLTEPVIFPLYKVNETSLLLQESIGMTNLPIIQNLACLDFYNLSQYSAVRRQVLFTLSQPGGHPHNWNLLVQNVLKLLSDYTELLNKLIETCDTSRKKTTIPITDPLRNIVQKGIETPKSFTNMRNMSLIMDSELTDVVELSREPLPQNSIPKQIVEKCKKKFKDFISFVKIVLGINFLFEELQEANFYRAFMNGQVIIWSSQAIAELACLSLTEDQYGIVLKDLPAIITTLITLKQNLDELNKIPTLTRKMTSHEGYNMKMKGAVLSAVKRSLFNISSRFGKYINELPLNKEVVNQLSTIVKN